MVILHQQLYFFSSKPVTRQTHFRHSSVHWQLLREPFSNYVAILINRCDWSSCPKCNLPNLNERTAKKVKKNQKQQLFAIARMQWLRLLSPWITPLFNPSQSVEATNSDHQQKPNIVSIIIVHRMSQAECCLFCPLESIVGDGLSTNFISAEKYFFFLQPTKLNILFD